MIEAVRFPGCAPALGGITLPMTDYRELGTPGNGEIEHGDWSFYNYHSYAFPLLFMLSLFTTDNCMPDGYSDFDVMYLSELDPTWDRSDLAFFANPEAAAVANPIAQAVCPVDAVAAAAGFPLDQLFWCAGSWGGLYPLSGTYMSGESLSTQTSMIAARSLAALHRRGLYRRTMGNDAMCGGVIDPSFPKTQYAMSEFFPVAEANGDHPIGQTSFMWGESREIPAVGEDALYVVWRWTDCCMPFF